VEYKGSEVVEFSVQKFPVKPVAYRGRCFKRVKNSNHQLSPAEISDMSLSILPSPKINITVSLARQNHNI
jgi:ATP-dependent DNA helicase RecG